MARGLLDDASFDQLAGNVQTAESGDDPTAVSPAGASGLMQLMPGTGRDMAAEVGEVYDPSNQKQNVKLGKRYLRKMLDKYRDIPTALAAYNWGPGNVDKWLARGGNWDELPAETQAYIERVTHSAAKGGGSASDKLNRAQLHPNAYQIAKDALGDWKPEGGAGVSRTSPIAYNVALAALRAGAEQKVHELPPNITESDDLNLRQLPGYKPRAA